MIENLACRSFNKPVPVNMCWGFVQQLHRVMALHTATNKAKQYVNPNLNRKTGDNSFQPKTTKKTIIL
jgi:hypothetical protein